MNYVINYIFTQALFPVTLMYVYKNYHGISYDEAKQALYPLSQVVEKPKVITIGIIGPRLPRHTWRRRHMHEEFKMVLPTRQKKTTKFHYGKQVSGHFRRFKDLNPA